MIRGVIFDLGGTLAVGDPLPAEELDRANAAALRAWLVEQGYDVPPTFIDAVVAERQAAFASRQGTREVTAAQALASALRRYGLPDDPDTLARAEAAFFEPELARMTPVPGAVEVLEALRRRGLRLGLLSNASSHLFVVECCRRLGLAPYLDPIVSSAQVGWAKPDPRPFEVILSAWALAASEVVMVGDTLQADVAGARAVGMRAIWLRPGPPPPEPADPPPDGMAGDLREVIALVEAWSRR
ncbi:MAG: HAD family hydrolase [Armatimonadota bacterium]|nr:HAD family hydrolase [Armatimonadota bacterium]MDR7436273.1 HAD family hydrolase [Armatimonadota bacterium]MDR7471347.1 HAD family hydrolase [Armatimonadota bacterium]MDR7506441.1 HAD family hydrolase [Armatimonadota bacterium]MDR7508996.1 HAD family hydrolase [Armatimonadota bacterium]